MAWTQPNNDHLYARIERLAARIRSGLEECQRLKDLAAAFGSEITDPASGDHLKAELINFRDNVIDPMLACFGNVEVPARDRMVDLQEWIVDAE